MKKVTIDLVKGAEGYSLQIIGKEFGYRYQGPKAWGNPYNEPTASFEVNLEDFIECLRKYAYDEEPEDTKIMGIDKILKDLNIEEAEIENWIQIPKEELDNIARKIKEVTEENKRLKEELKDIKEEAEISQRY